MSDKQAIYEKFAPLLDRPWRGYDGRLWSFCPCHPDGTKHQGQANRGQAGRSLSLHPRIGLTCFANCRYEDIVKALENGNRQPTATATRGRDRLVAIYNYIRADGTLAAQKRRYEGPDGKRFEWPVGTKMADMPLYGADAVAQAPPDAVVWLVEGEKAMEACVDHGLLAVTVPGSSSQTDFGDSLQVLAGHPVRLWPDNDTSGRQLMTLLAGLLKGVASSVTFVMPPIALPLKGDAFDYFELNGTIEALEKALPPTEAVAEVLGDNALRVKIPTAGGVTTWVFTELEAGPRRLDTFLTVALGPGEPYSERRNLYSGSQRTELRRDLEAFYDKETPWARVINTAYTKAKETFEGLDPSERAANIPVLHHTELFAVVPLLPDASVTILFGDGGSGKSYIAAGLLLAFALGHPLMGLSFPRRAGLYVDYEDSALKFRWRLERLAQGLGVAVPSNIHYWPAKGVPFAQLVRAIRTKVQRDAIGFLAMDSAAAACGDEAEKQASASALFRSIQSLGPLATLLLAHTTKQLDPNGKLIPPMKPFGSAFWHNSARRTWWLNREQELEATVLEAALVCRKVNDGPYPGPIPISLNFEDPDGPIRITRGDFEPQSELAKGSLPLNSRIKLALGQTGLIEIPELLEALGLPKTKANYDRMYVTLQRGLTDTPRRRAYYVRQENKWGLLQHDAIEY